MSEQTLATNSTRRATSATAPRGDVDTLNRLLTEDPRGRPWGRRSTSDPDLGGARGDRHAVSLCRGAEGPRCRLGRHSPREPVP